MDSYEITFKSWENVAAIYQDNFMELDLYNDTYDKFCELIQKPNPYIFEIGCGPGNITKYLLSKRPDFNIEAIDVAPSMIKLAKENIPGAKFAIMDCREIHSITAKFDGIMCGFCLPYLSKEAGAKLIKDCAALLNSDGIFYISTIEGDYHQSGYETGSKSSDKMFVYYHQADYLKAELEENKFKTINLIRKEYSRRDETTSIHLIFIAHKK